MAIFHAQSIPLSRSSGRSAVAAAAYRAADELVDEREARTHDYARKRGVVLTEIVLPGGSALATEQRGALWNAAERAETRKNARTAREWVVALPHELSAAERAELVHAFAAELAERYGVAVDVAIHAPHREGDPRNHHAHLLATTRRAERDADGRIVLGEKASIELSDAYRRRAGLGSGAQELEAVRARWAELANSALERAGHVERIDHRSLKAQGIDREATVHLGPVASMMERRHRPSARGDVNREVAGANAQRVELGAQMAEMHAELGAVVIDLEAERARRAERKRERLAQAERLKLEREQAEKAAAAARAAKVAAEQQRAARERQEAEKLAQEQAERERLEGMSSAELMQEIRRHSPPVKAFVERLPRVVAARDRARELADALKKAKWQRRRAADEAHQHRALHPWRAKQHDLGLWTDGYLRERANLEAHARKEVKRLQPLALEAELQFEALKKSEMQRIREHLTPQREHVARLVEMRDQKREQERQHAHEREVFARAVEHVEDLARLGTQDSRVLPEELRALVDRASKAAPGREREGLVQQALRASPELQRVVGQELERARSRGRGR